MKKYILTFLSVFAICISALTAEAPRWMSMPISVYIQPYGQMSTYMKNAFLAWENKSNGLVRFKFTPSPSNADIEVEFVDFVSNCAGAHDVGCAELATYGNRYRKAYVTIGTKEYARSRSSSGAYSRQIVPRSKEHIYGVMLHEAGHAIGLGHSSSPNSIMYPYDLDTMQYLTNEDLKLIYNKYH